jgi:hypothetical protein
LENVKLPNTDSYALGCTFTEAQSIYDTLSGNISSVNEDLNDLKEDLYGTPTLKYHLVELNLDGSVKQSASSLIWSTISANMTNSHKIDILDIIWELAPNSNTFTRFHAPLIGITEANYGDLVFCSCIQYGAVYPLYMMFTLDTNDVLTTKAVVNYELSTNKVQSVIANSSSIEYYPSAKAVYDEFRRKPVVIWETDSTGLTALETDMSANPNWQLTNLDFSPYSYVKIYTKAAQKTGTTASASTTPAIVLEMSLDPRAAGPYGNHYIGSVVFQKSNDANRLATVCCAISADKTSFAVIRMTTLYGTAATANKHRKQKRAYA